MKKLIRWLCVAALALTLLAGMKTALSYFTTFVVAKGQKPIVLGDRTSLEEEFGAWIKRVRVTAEGPDPVFVRVRAFADEGLTLAYSSDGGWAKDGDWWYYAPMLTPGQQTDELRIQINDVPAEPQAGDIIQVAVVQECTPARFRPDGTAYADWNEGKGGATP